MNEQPQWSVWWRAALDRLYTSHFSVKWPASIAVPRRVGMRHKIRSLSPTEGRKKGLLLPNFFINATTVCYSVMYSIKQHFLVPEMTLYQAVHFFSRIWYITLLEWIQTKFRTLFLIVNIVSYSCGVTGCVNAEPSVLLRIIVSKAFVTIWIIYWASTEHTNI